MRTLSQTLAIFIAGTTICFAQDTQEKERLEGFDWLTQFEGSWTVVTKSVTGGQQSSTSQKGTMDSRIVGRNWVVNTHNADFGSMKYEAIQTIGYDKKKKQFVGTWIDSMMKHTWDYTGSLDETGTTLTLEAEGPDMSNLSKMKRYRDVFEFETENRITSFSQIISDQGEWETFQTSILTRNAEATSAAAVTPFLMFQGNAVAAIELYKTVFEDFEVESMDKYKAGEPGKEVTIEVASILIAGQRIKCIDSPIKHDFDFTPSFSFFIECESEDQLKQRFDKLAEGGNVMMPLNDYGFSKQFGWVSDKFGVSWQLNLK